MKILIPMETRAIAHTPVPTVNARELHKWLGVKKDFSDWIRGRIEKFDFKQGRDFITVAVRQLDSPKLGNQKASHGGNRRAVEYHVTVGMAKELSMVERTARGKEVRQYFINVEERAANRPHKISKPEWEALRASSIRSFKLQSGMVKLVRDEAGKDTVSHHYSTEARLVNSIVFREFCGVDRETLTKFELGALERLQMHNCHRISQGWDYDKRKAELPSVFASFKAKWQEREAKKLGGKTQLQLEGLSA